ncbi:PqqD family peptide modification chaperone [Anderseniella sp. Alg231-50]|uniref:PqqD family peptide modification chaperone n=1 Tax=Anderseniella sp. Alg231-50 TaxID=1922226 RepID=UPI000D54FDBD
MSQQNIKSDSILIRTSQLPAAELGPDDTVLLDAERGVYYGLEGPARQIWEKLSEEVTLDDICTSLVKEYDVEREQCESDTRDFIAELIENGLVKVR